MIHTGRHRHNINKDFWPGAWDLHSNTGNNSGRCLKMAAKLKFSAYDTCQNRQWNSVPSVKRRSNGLSPSVERTSNDVRTSVMWSFNDLVSSVMKNSNLYIF